MRKIILCLSLAGFLYSQDTPFTNMFERASEDAADTAEKKRSTYSLMNSGNKVGFNIGYNYVINSEHNMFTAFSVDIPFSRVSAVTFHIGFENIPISSFSIDSDANAVITNLYGTNINVPQGEGELRYLTITGLFKAFFSSVWLGVGLSYHRFIDGYIQDDIPSTVFSFTYKINDYSDSVYAVGTLGFLSEIRENVFLTPELRFMYRLPPGSIRMVGSITTGLLFKL
ncbi:hypothetical protein ACFL6D_04115 [Spirochaetota bacterium]